MGLMFRTICCLLVVVVAVPAVWPSLASGTPWNCTLQPNLPCTAVYRPVDCFVYPPNVSTLDVPSKPILEDKDIQYEAIPGTENDYHLQIRWQPPLDGSLSDLEGFKVSLIQMSMPVGPRGCYHFDLKEAVWRGLEARQAWYNATFDVEGGHKYKIILYSLPLAQYSNNNETKEKDIPQGPDLLAKANWITDITVRQKWEGLVIFNFSLAPADFGFEEYFLVLRSCEEDGCNDRFNEDSYTVPSNSSPTVTRVFENVTPGLYRIKVKPYSRNSAGDCVCQDFDYCGCKTSWSEIFQVTEFEETTTTSTERVTTKLELTPPPANEAFWEYVGPIIALVLLLVIASFILGAWYRHSPCQHGKKTVFIVSSDDFSAHKNVLQELSAYLKDIGCFVHTYFANDHPSLWYLRRADAVFIMCSNEDIYKKLMEIDDDPHSHRIPQDAFLRTYKYIQAGRLTVAEDGRDKIHLVSFPYMPYPDPKEDIPKLTERDLHKLETFIFGESADGPDSMPDQAKLEELKSAIAHAANQRVLDTHGGPCVVGLPSIAYPVEPEFRTRGGSCQASVSSWRSRGAESVESVNATISPSEIVIRRDSLVEVDWEDCASV